MNDPESPAPDSSRPKARRSTTRKTRPKTPGGPSAAKKKPGAKTRPRGATGTGKSKKKPKPGETLFPSSLNLKHFADKTNTVLEGLVTDVKNFTRKSGDQIKQAHIAETLNQFLQKNREQFQHFAHLHKLNTHQAALKRQVSQLLPVLGKKTLDLLEAGSLQQADLEPLVGEIHGIQEQINQVEKEIEALLNRKPS